MATLLYRLGRFAYDRRWLVLSVWIVVILAVGGSAAAFHGAMTNTFQIPGTETQRMLDKLKADLPSSAGGSASIVFESPDAAMTAGQKQAVSDALAKIKKLDGVQNVTDPFAAQAQLDGAAPKLANARKQLDAGQAQLDAGKQQLAAAASQLAASKAQLDDGQARLDAQKQALAAQGVPDAMISQATAGAQAQLDAGRAQLAAGQAKYDAGKKQSDEGAAKLAQAKTDLAFGERQAKATEGLRFVSTDGKAAIASIQFTKSTDALTPELRKQVQDLAGQVPGVQAHASKELTQDISSLFGTSEGIGVAVAAIVLLVMLGTLVAAGLPLLMALAGVAVGVGGTFALTGVIQMSSTTPMLGLMLGLAVGIDYSLFIVNRHRTQLLHGMDPRESVARATGTSGNAVLFAGLTVIIALAALVVPGLPFLAVMGIAAAATVAVAVLIAITLLPALLGFAGRRIISKRRWAKADAENARAGHEEDEARQDLAKAQRGWGAWVTRHPAVALIASVVLLGALALPASQLRLALPDGGSEPVDSSAFKAYDATGKYFGQGMTGPIVVVGELPAGLDATAAKTKQLDVADELRSVPGVTAAVPVALSNDRRTAVFQVIPTDGPASASTVQVVHDIRAKGAQIQSGTGVAIGLTGQTAANVDVSTKLADALPPYLAIVVGLSLVLLLLVFRSILVPLLATGGFLLSLGAAFGSVVAVYQWGWLGQVFDVPHPGAVLSFLPILLIGILFGLAMDYQVFITSGIREAWVHGQEAHLAVRTGFSHAARVVTAAAIIMVSVFAGFIFSHLTMIRPLGFALALGVLLDAFVVRMTLVPAVMRLLGKGAWWLPRWLDRLLPDLDIEGAKLAAPAAPQQQAEPAGMAGAGAVRRR
ncbi:MMPL family transporter [Paenarthrobacter sp. DKR-5]|uniref:MMPL family transporter n=1 Tax=Paenarthrobacter sp. DKR-5 TaxID=2835535 RepID=UPI001BDC5529|nr:MMPL family transporter [Paenarthrobacter sp. DKR-5]MBT1002519.1 MMPL family transporter [Paenarthrobacter sp. DKR-5]